MQDLNKLNTFVRVAEHKSFTRAARDLHMTPSAVSKHIHELEAALGIALLNRSTRGVALTEVGEQFFGQCIDILGHVDAAVTTAQNLQGKPQGTLRIHVVAGYAQWVLAPLLPRFMRRYPELQVEVTTETPALSLVEAGVDVVVSGKTAPDPGVVHRELGIVEYVICASPEYFRTNGLPKRPQDLANHNCLVHTLFAPKEWPFKASPRDVVVRVKGTFRSNSSEVLAQAAVAGVGIVRLPRYTVAGEVAAGRLQTIFDGLTRSRQTMRVYFPATKYLPAKTTAFIDFLAAAVSGRA
ncbi:MAG: LysR family transcriptional regulator [Gemmatimonas sp.]